MNIKIVATRSCSHRPNIEKELNDLGVAYEVLYVEENSDIVAKYAIRHSPNIIVNNKLMCRGQPSEGELKALLEMG
ncbi:MAG: thioredoxin family protein [Gammaproteobacteria bacterium]|nr:thioredoxin family protein [Gammaproteobacteria bacterium]